MPKLHLTPKTTQKSKPFLRSYPKPTKRPLDRDTQTQSRHLFFKSKYTKKEAKYTHSLFREASATKKNREKGGRRGKEEGEGKGAQRNWPTGHRGSDLEQIDADPLGHERISLDLPQASHRRPPPFPFSSQFSPRSSSSNSYLADCGSIGNGRIVEGKAMQCAPRMRFLADGQTGHENENKYRQ